jgi:hypothetical protein
MLHRILGVGDVADVHLASAAGHNGHYAMKISRVDGAAPMLANEWRVLSTLLARAAAADSHYGRYFPAPAEWFPATQGQIHKRVNVFAYRPGFYTLEQVRQRYPSGLDGRHLAWIFKRLLTAIGFTHRCGWVHGAVLPPHALLQADEHGLQLVGWGHAVHAGARIRTISTRYRDWYPTEVLRKKKAGPATDVFLAAKCLVYLGGGDPRTDQMPGFMPQQMQWFLKRCLFPNPAGRPGDAWALLDEFDRLLLGLYGPPAFYHLTMS